MRTTHQIYTYAAGVFLCLALLVFAPLVTSGYILTLDLIWAPRMSHIQHVIDIKGPLYYGRLPFALLLDGAAAILPMDVLQKLVLMSIIFVSGLVGMKSSPARTPAGKFTTGLLYAINPFVYTRFLAGHWYLLLSYAVLPLAVWSFYQYLSTDKRLSHAVLWATLVSIFDPHGTVLLAIIGGTLTLTHTIHRGLGELRSVLAQTFKYCAGFLLLNAYWILPVLVDLTTASGTLSKYSAADLFAFSANPTINESTILSILMLYGFWRTGYLTTLDILPSIVVFSVFTLLLTLVFYGVVQTQDKSLRNGLIVSSIVCAILAMGSTGTFTGGFVTSLFETVPGLLAMRDTQKFSIVLCISYSWFSGTALDQLVKHPPVNFPQKSSLSISQLLFVGIVLIGAVTYSAPMMNGFHGQLTTNDYPDSWAVLNESIRDKTANHRTLVLPWHQYMKYSFTNRVIANPTDIYFDGSILRGRNVEVGDVESNAPFPAHRQVRDILSNNWTSKTGFGEATAELGVKYIVLFKSADYQSYAYLDKQPDLRPIDETSEYKLYLNTAYTIDNSAEWPVMTNPVPRTALIFGTVISLLTSFAIVFRLRVKSSLRWS